MPTSEDPMGAVLQDVAAFNNADSTAMAAACADPIQILEPHVWQGSTAAEDWWRESFREGEYLGAFGLPHRARRTTACRCQRRQRLRRRPRRP